MKDTENLLRAIEIILATETKNLCDDDINNLIVTRQKLHESILNKKRLTQRQLINIAERIIQVLAITNEICHIIST